MSDRLTHLHRQQTLLREHLAWIEGEIAKESAAVSPVPANSSVPQPQPLASAPPSLPVAQTTASTPAEADALIEQYAKAERQNPSDIRRGCFFVFAAALLLVAGVVGVVWVFFYSN